MKPKANLAHVVSTQAGGTSQANGSDLYLSIFSLSVTTPIVCYSGDSEWILDTGATYHRCPNRNWFSSFEKLDGCFVVMDNDRPCNMEGIDTLLVKIFLGMVPELKEVRYVPQLKKNPISVGVLKALDLEISNRECVLKMLRGSMVVLKGVRHKKSYT